MLLDRNMNNGSVTSHLRRPVNKAAIQGQFVSGDGGFLKLSIFQKIDCLFEKTKLK